MGRGGGSRGGHSGGHGRSHYGGSRSRSSSSRSTSRSYSSSSYRSSRPYYRHTTIVGGGLDSTFNRPNDPLQGYKSALLIWNTLVVFALLFIGGTIISRITPSTIKREPLQKQQCIESEYWYEDNDGTWIYNEDALIKGMRSFYETTGIQPYLVIDTGDINGNDEPSAKEYEAYLMDIYSEKFNDGGHLVVGFNEPYPDSYGMYYVIGDEAKAVFNDEAGEILFDYIDYYYTSDMSDEELFSTAFAMTAKRMMSKSFTVVQGITVIAVIIVLGDIILLTLLGMAVYKKKKAESDREVANVLGADIADVTDTSLKDKYL